MTDAAAGPAATIVIVTRNRKDLARRAVESALGQQGHHDILVIDDGSTDGTASELTAVHPRVRVVSFDQRAGLVVRRNDAARLAKGAVLVSIDDDAVFDGPDVVATSLQGMSHARVGAVAIPHRDVGGENASSGPVAPDGRDCWVTTTFRGCAYAVRKDVFLALGGFREQLVHQGEERDFCLRLLSSGWVVRLGWGTGITHFVSDAGRDFERMDTYGRRNEVLYAFWYLPVPIMLVAIARFMAIGFLTGVRVGRVSNMVVGFSRGVRACWEYRADRAVVPKACLRTHAAIRRRGAVRFTMIEADLAVDRLSVLNAPR